MADNAMIYVYISGRARKNFPQWLGKTFPGKSFSIEAYDEYGHRYKDGCYITGDKDKNVYDDLKRISLGKLPETMALLYIDYPITLFSSIAKIIVGDGIHRIKFLGPLYNKKGVCNVYKNGLVLKETRKKCGNLF